MITLLQTLRYQTYKRPNKSNLLFMLSRLLSHKGKKKKENPKAGTATNDHINYPLNSNHNLVSGYSFPDYSLIVSGLWYPQPPFTSSGRFGYKPAHPTPGPSPRSTRNNLIASHSGDIFAELWVLSRIISPPSGLPFWTRPGRLISYLLFPAETHNPRWSSVLKP